MSSIIYVTVTATGGQGATGVGVPTGGTINQVIVKNSATNYDTSWKTVVPNGGTTGQVLAKTSNLDLQTAWVNPLPETSLLLTDISVFYVTSNTIMNTSYPQVLPLSKDSGGLTIASNVITLTKGYVYEASFTFRANGSGFALIRGVDAGTGIVFKTDAFVSTATSTYGDSDLIGGGILDLSAAGVDGVVRLANLSQAGGITFYGGIGNSKIIIRKYKKVVV